MPKIHTFPTLYDECKTVSISKLKEWGYIKPGQRKTGTITWSTNGVQHSSIGIKVDTISASPYIEFEYKCNDRSINYKVDLVTMPSNIGKGLIWYFLCPNTNERCRKLYLADTYFLHRKAFTGCMYEKQTYSKKVREQIKVYEEVIESENVCKQLYSKYFKKFYKGRLTKKYLRIRKQIDQLRDKSVSIEELLLL